MRYIGRIAPFALLAVLAAVVCTREGSRPPRLRGAPNASRVEASTTAPVPFARATAPERSIAAVPATAPASLSSPMPAVELLEDPRGLAAWLLDRSDEEIKAFERTPEFERLVAAVVRGLSTPDREDRASILELDSFLTRLNQRILSLRKPS